MTTAELHEILDDENRKLTATENWLLSRGVFLDCRNCVNRKAGCFKDCKFYHRYKKEQTMSREKHIETPEDEKGASGYSKLAWKLWQEVKLPMTQCETIDRIVREEGYLKHSEGEWGIIKIGDGEKVRTCSNCYISQSVNVYNGKVMFNYCPYCGAKMKGGAE